MRDALAFYAKHLLIGLRQLPWLGGVLTGWWGLAVGLLVLAGVVNEVADFFQVLRPYGWYVIAAVYFASVVGAAYKTVRDATEERDAEKARADALERVLNPPEQLRIETARRLLRDGRDVGLDKARAGVVREEAQMYFADAARLVFAVVKKGRHTDYHNEVALHGRYQASILRDPPQAVRSIAESLENIAEMLESPPEKWEDKYEEFGPYLRPDFIPRNGRTWRDH